MMNNVTQLVNDNLYAINLVSYCTPGQLPRVKETDYRWKQEIINRNKKIGQLQGISWDTMWAYLIKPHSQQTTIKFISNSIYCIILEFSDATYIGWLHWNLIHPEEVKEMLKICHLGTSTSTDNQWVGLPQDHISVLDIFI